MMIHAALCWPKHNEKDIWPLALSHAVHLHNRIPLTEIRLTPNKLWSICKSSYSAVVQAHPFGCPFYMMQPQLQDGLPESGVSDRKSVV